MLKTYISSASLNFSGIPFVTAKVAFITAIISKLNLHHHYYYHCCSYCDCYSMNTPIALEYMKLNLNITQKGYAGWIYLSLTILLKDENSQSVSKESHKHICFCFIPIIE